MRLFSFSELGHYSDSDYRDDQRTNLGPFKIKNNFHYFHELNDTSGQVFSTWEAS